MTKPHSGLVLAEDKAAEARARSHRSARGNAGNRVVVYFTDGTPPAFANDLESVVGVSRQTIASRYRRLREAKAEVTIEALKQRPSR